MGYVYRVPPGMYFNCRNAVARNAYISLAKCLAKLRIKSAEDFRG